MKKTLLLCLAMPLFSHSMPSNELQSALLNGKTEQVDPKEVRIVMEPNVEVTIKRETRYTVTFSDSRESETYTNEPAIDFLFDSAQRKVAFEQQLFEAVEQYINTPGTVDMLINAPNGYHIYFKKHLDFGFQKYYAFGVDPIKGQSWARYVPNGHFELFETSPQFIQKMSTLLQNRMNNQ